MAPFRDLLTTFDDATDWPEDPFLTDLDDAHPVIDWALNVSDERNAAPDPRR